MKRFHHFLTRASARMKGWRTLAIFSPVALLALLDAMSAIDLSPLFVGLGVPEPSRAAIVTGMSLLAIGLRVYTTTPPMRAAPPVERQG